MLVLFVVLPTEQHLEMANKNLTYFVDLRSPIISIKPLPILYFVASPLISFPFPTGARFHLPFLVSSSPSPFRYFSGILYVNLH